MTKNNRNGISISDIGSYILTKGWVYLLLFAALYLLYKSISKGDVRMAMALGTLPLIVAFFITVLNNSTKGFYLLFSAQLALVAAGMFFEIKMGLTTLILTLALLALLVIYNIYRKVNWRQCWNIMFFVFIVWGVYCVFEIFNPNNVQEAWNISITHYLVYPLACAVLVPLAMKTEKSIHWILILWSVFILIAAWKGYYQKNYGFNEKELYFLYVLGGAKTHIIWSGIRYFSCFSDAANFGVHTAMAVVIFGISAFFVQNKFLKIYFLVIAGAGIYCMGISGTRAAIVIPLGAAAMFILLSKNRKYALTGFVMLSLMLLFFRFTNYGDGNQYIRKMRSAFFPTEDASYLLRVENRRNMAELMKDKPFGYGQGLSKGERFYPRERMPYPPDSWLVSVWVENGIVGLVLYLVVHGVLFAWCSWILMFKIMNKRLRGLLMAWLCMNAGFFISAYVNDVMQYPNSIIVYTGFALCLAGPYMDKYIKEEEDKKKELEMT